MLLLDCLDPEGAHNALAGWQRLHESAQVDVSVDHLRLLCGGPSKRHTLSAMLPIIALHRHALARASHVSFMHAIILPGDISQLASFFPAKLKFLGFIDCDLTSSPSVLQEAVDLPGLSVLQLRFDFSIRDSDEICIFVRSACVAGQVRAGQQGLVIEVAHYPFADAENVYLQRIGFDDPLSYYDWLEVMIKAWDALTLTKGSPSFNRRVTLREAKACLHFFPFDTWVISEELM